MKPKRDHLCERWQWCAQSPVHICPLMGCFLAQQVPVWITLWICQVLHSIGCRLQHSSTGDLGIEGTWQWGESVSNGKDSLKILAEGAGRRQGREFQSSLTERRIKSHSLSAESGTLSKTLTWAAPESHCPLCHFGLTLPLPHLGEHLCYSLPHLQVCPFISISHHCAPTTTNEANDVSGPFCGWI